MRTTREKGRLVLVAAGLAGLIPALANAQAVARVARVSSDAAPARAVANVRSAYVGGWEGTLTRVDGGAAKVAMRFAVVDAERQVFSGETTVDGKTSAHLELDGPAPRSAQGGAGGFAVRRSAGGGDGGDGGAAAATGGTAVAMRRSADGGAPAAPVLRWQEKDATGATLVYSAQLVTPDELKGTVHRQGSAPDEAPIGTFLLRRQK